MDKLELERIVSLAGLYPALYEVRTTDRIYAVAVTDAGGVAMESRPLGAPPPPPPPLPPDDGWKAVEPVNILTPETDQVQLLYPAQSAVVEMRVRFKWTPLADLTDEYEPFALVRRKGTRAIWSDLPLYFVLRSGNARFRTGVGVVMDDKATDEKRWRPEAGKVHHVSARIDFGGTVYLEIDGPSGTRWAWTTPRPTLPKEGKPGPWPWDLMLQLGGPSGETAGHAFSDIVLEVREEA